MTRTKVVTIAPGVVSYHETYATAVGPEQVSLLSVDLTKPGIRLGGVEAGDHLIHYADEKTSAMANRSGAVAGVNGDYFDQGHSGAPLGGVVINGLLLKTQRAFTDANVHREQGRTRSSVGQLATSGTVTDTTGAYPAYPISAVNDLVEPHRGAASSPSPAPRAPAVKVPAGHRSSPASSRPGGRPARHLDSSRTRRSSRSSPPAAWTLYAPAGSRLDLARRGGPARCRRPLRRARLARQRR